MAGDDGSYGRLGDGWEIAVSVMVFSQICTYMSTYVFALVWPYIYGLVALLDSIQSSFSISLLRTPSVTLDASLTC